MQKWSSFLLFLSLPFLVFSQKTKTDNIDRYLQQWMKEDSIPGALLLVTKDGAPLKEKAYGWAAPGTKKAVTRTIQFETGSITHLFTAIAILQLEEAGKLHLDSSILNYIDSLSLGWKLVTPRTLLYHCHGLNPEHYDKSLLPGAPGFRYSVREQLFHMRISRLYALAGTAVYYSESAYFLLGVLIERLSGQSYEEYVREHIFIPAGMQHSGFISQVKDSSLFLKTYTRYQDKWVPWRLQDLLRPLDCNSSMGITSTVDDLLLLDKALQQNKLIKKESNQKITETFTMPDGKPASSGRNAWGMGCSTRTVGGHLCMAAVSTTGCAYYHFPAEHISVYLVTNLGDGDDYLNNKGAYIPIKGYALLEEIVTKYFPVSKTK